MNPVNETEEPDVGALLKSKREGLGLTIAEIAEKTRIRRAYLAALEENRFDALPAPAYLSGFLRIYAAALGLDPEALLRSLRAQADLSEPAGRQAVTLSVPSSRGRRQRRSLPFLLLAGLAAVGLLIYVQYGHDRLRDASPAPNLKPAPFPAVVGAGVSAAPEKVATAAEESAVEPTVAPPEFPGIPAAGGMLRLEASAPVVLEVEVDDRKPQRYDLRAASVLRWKVEHRFRLAADPPQAIALWLDEAPLVLGGRSELELLAAEKGDAEEVLR